MRRNPLAPFIYVKKEQFYIGFCKYKPYFCLLAYKDIQKTYKNR
ncbi:Uncharacterised protein [uncultured Bacteroides sp.]|nr:Uncharacterised protein [uncultured Bacteroides sp.]